MKKQEKEFEWAIHYIANGVACDHCGDVENPYPQYMCNAHTHGMERYGHLDFQVVLDMGPQIIGYLLNSMGRKVQSGEKFKSEDVISGLFENCTVRLVEVEDSGRTVLRLIIPDSNNHFPEDEGCAPPYNKQLSFLIK